MHCSRRFIVQTLVFDHSYLHRQVSPPETIVVKGGNTWARNEFCLKMPDFHVTFRDLLHAVNLRHGTNGFTSFPKEGALKFFFFALKNPTASAGFEPANLGTKGQHATSRPPKQLTGLSLSSVDVKYAWSNTSFSPRVFMFWCQGTGPVIQTQNTCLCIS